MSRLGIGTKAAGSTSSRSEPYHEYLHLPAIAGEARLVPLAALVSADLSLAALRQGAQRGRLKASQSADGTWQSTRKDVNDYKRNRGKRR